MPPLAVFRFIPNTRELVVVDAFVARVSGDLKTSKELFELLYQVLLLPGYFGFNWNALFDCLRDFHWIDREKVIIVHDDLPMLPSSEMRTYLEVLRDAALDWKPGEAHSLEVVFRSSDRALIDGLLVGS